MSEFKKTLKAIQNTEGVDAVQSQSDLAEKLDNKRVSDAAAVLEKDSNVMNNL